MPAVEEHLTAEETREICQDLLNTIKIPRNMSLLQQKLPASQYENEKVDEDSDEDKYEDDFEQPDRSKKVEKKPIGQGANVSEPKQKYEKTERTRKRPKGLPPTAPSNKAIPPMPQSNRNRDVQGLNINSSEIINRNVQSRKSSRGSSRIISEGERKKRKNPKTMEAQDIQPPPINRYKKYRMYSREGMGQKKVSEIYRMRAKEVETHERRVEKDLRNKYQDRVINPNNKYLSRDYAVINRSAKKNMEHQRRIIIDPTKNSQRLEQILGKNQAEINSKHYKRRYQPLSENYRGGNNTFLIDLF